jgi:hypothetical protein
LLGDDDVWSKSKQQRRQRSGDGRLPPPLIYASMPVEEPPTSLGEGSKTRESERRKRMVRGIYDA